MEKLLVEEEISKADIKTCDESQFGESNIY